MSQTFKFTDVSTLNGYGYLVGYDYKVTNIETSSINYSAYFSTTSNTWMISFDSTQYAARQVYKFSLSTDGKTISNGCYNYIYTDTGIYYKDPVTGNTCVPITAEKVI